MTIQKKLLQPRKPKAQRKPRQGNNPPMSFMGGYIRSNWKASKHAKGRKA